MWKHTLAKRIKQAREDNGYTQKEMSEELGVSIQSLSAWENEKALPSFKNLEALSTITHVPVEQFFVAKPLANSQKLTNAECNILDLYRHLNAEGQSHADAIMRSLVANIEFLNHKQ